MAYGNYYYGYNPAYNQSDQYRQSYQNNMTGLNNQSVLPTQMSGTNQDERIWVSGTNAAEAYLMAPNSFVRLWDSNDALFYEKRTDPTGRPYPMEVYRYTRENPGQQQRDNISAFESKLNSLEKRLEMLEGKRGAEYVPESNADDSAV